MKRLISLCLATAFLLVPAGFAPAQGEFDEDGRRIYYNPKTEIDINEGVTIDGVIQGPGITFVRGTDDITWNPLVKLRLNFNPEMVQSVHEIE